MKNLSSSLLCVVAIMILFSHLRCKEEETSPNPWDNLETRFLNGYIAADLMPVVPPDPVLCQITLLARNSSSSETISGLKISMANVFRDSANLRLGTITFSTSWDGQLGPSEQDTVRLNKVVTQTSPFTPPCGKYVYLNLIIEGGRGSSKTMKIDSLLFTCTF